MKLEDFCNAAFHSADSYLKYLRNANKGIDVVRVVRIRYSENKFYLYLEKKPPISDSLVIKIASSLFPLELKGIVEIVCFSDSPAIVVIKVKPEYLEAFKTLEPSMITFESDLIFLVEAVKKWYLDHYRSIKNELGEPELKNITEFSFDNTVNISQNQCEAIKTALTSNISYIWGAPGTGKTQYVLSNCIIEYVKKGKKVILMAPTNNALDQSLIGIIRAFEENNISLSKLIRLGVPTSSFAAKHPDICVSIISDYKIKRLKKEIEALTNENIAQIEYQSTLNKFEQFKTLSVEYAELEAKYTELLKNKYEIDRELSLYKSQLQVLKNSIDSKNHSYEILLKEKNSFWSKLKCIFSEKYKSNLELRISEILKHSSSLNAEINIVLSHIYQCESQLNNLNEEITNTHTKIDNCCKLAVSLSPASFDNQTKVEDVTKAFENYFEVHKHIEIDSSLTDTINKKQAELEKYLSKQKIELFDRYVVACTVDYAFLHYGEFPQNVDKDAVHLFVDEAAYCPMIKAGIFFSYGIPVTFLGDHMQLPPICEIKESEVRESQDNAFLWAQSSMYFPEVFLKESNMENMLMRFLENQDVNKLNIEVISLNETHRFGNNLATILDKFVYKFGFTGKSNDETKITVINVQRNPSEKDFFVNLEEVNAIKQFLKSYDCANKELAILTPYRKQRSELKKYLGSNVEISTIHASQGREWDTVVISVVERHRKFLMDSTNIECNGLKIINTAISRAKKELILVLDYEHWKNYSHQQLISNIAVNHTTYLDSKSF